METRPDGVDMHPASVRHDANERREIARVVSATIASACDSHIITMKQNTRYQLFLACLVECTEVTIVLLSRPWPIECIWPVSKLLVHDALMFYQHIQRMVANDTSGLFRVDRGVYPMVTPTYIVYHTLRSLGMKARFRGPQQSDPGSLEHLYYKMWTFENDKSFQDSCVRNARCDVTDYPRQENIMLTDTEVRLILARFS